MSKRKNEADGDDGPSGLASKRAHITPGTNSTTENPPSSSGLKNTLHGNVFQLKLLSLFLLRGINAGFQFRLGTEIPGMGGKFDDLIFKFKNVRNINEATSSGEQTESYRFLQAKHKQNEDKEKITAADLLKDNDGDFSLPKYFRSFYREIIKENEGILPENVQDCIICTNIGFDSDEELRESGIELIPLEDHNPILTWPSDKKSPTRYKLRKTDQLRIMTGWPDIHLLAKTLLDDVTNKRQLNLSSPIFKSYHVALVAEKVIEKKVTYKTIGKKKVIDKIEGKLCSSFVNGDNSRFREILSELTFVHYWAKIKLKHKGRSMELNLLDEMQSKEGMSKHTESTPKTLKVVSCLFEDVEDSEQTEISFTKNFIHGINLYTEGQEIRRELRDAVFIHYWEDLTIQLSKAFGRKIISSTPDENKSLKDLVGEKEIDDFLDKLVFAVHTPNEVELDGILKNEVGNYYNLHESDFQSDFILRNMLDWFKEKESKFMTSKEGIDILENGRKKVKPYSLTSFEYQNQPKKMLGFNEITTKTTGSASKRARMTPSPSGTNPRTENPPSSSGLENTLHVNLFQLKLLMLFLLRGIGAGFQFHLGTEIPGMGGKFDDLIFKFKNVRNINEATSSDEQTESYRFLQAKHKQNEKEKITAADLLNDNDKGEFSLPKYFRSYYRDIIKRTEGIFPENVQDCIICTNIGFDSDAELRKKGIELIPLDEHDPILTFDKVPSDKKSPTRYRLEKTKELRRIMTGWSDMHLLAKTLLDDVTNKRQLNLSSSIFKSYHFALVEKKVIDKKEGKLCTTFLEGDNSRFREILSEITFVHYLGKLKLKRDGKKKSRVDSSKKLTDFDETYLRKLLPKFPQNKTQSMELDLCVFEEVYDELIAENIIEGEGRTSKKESFTDNFLNGIKLPQEGREFRGKLRNAVFIHYWENLTILLSRSFGRKMRSSTPADENKSLNDLIGEKIIDDFLDKLVFAVHTPNEVELDDILKNEVSDRYSLNESDLQSDFILRNMMDWFKEKESKFMTSEEGKNIFKEGEKKMKLLRVTAISIDYQKQLKAVLEFDDEAVDEMKDKIIKLLESPDRIGRIDNPLPKRTAVKVIEALEKLREEKTKKTITHNATMLEEYFQYEDSYLVMSSSRLQKDDGSELIKTLTSENSHHLLVVVYEDLTEKDDELYQKLVENMPNKRIIIIRQDEVEDKLNFSDLSEKSKRALLEKEIEFQGTLKSVGDLIKRGDTTLDDLIENGDAEEVIDSNSIEELLTETGYIRIPACSSARFEPELYVERRMEHPWENSFYDQLAASMKCTTDELQKECTVDSQGYIHWLNVMEEDRKEEIWEQMKIIVEKKERQNSRDSQLSNGNVIAEKDLMNKENRKGQVFIVSGLAGTGKSTILSNYYERIKESNPDTWVIRIDLVDYNKELAKFNFSREPAVGFFAEIFAKDSCFTRSLLTHRFRTDGRIVVMLDGFDEIDGKLHEKVFQLINAVKLTKMDALYITTRSHLKGKLQDEFFQFSFTFKNFSPEDQVDCLSKYWGSKLKMSQTNEDGPIQSFAKSLVERLKKTLNNRESDLIGIPLQCRMLAECFETQLQDAIQQGPIATLIENISENDLDLASLYSLFMERKLEIYRSEKVKADPHHYRANSSIDKQIEYMEEYLGKLAIRTIVPRPKDFNVLLRQPNSFLSNQKICQEDEEFARDCVSFGFLDVTDKGEVKFLNQTYAEFLFAKYLYAGFLPEDNKKCNNLLTSKSVRELIFMKILGRSSYDCSGVRVFLNSMLKERVQPRDDIPFQIEKYVFVLNNAVDETNSNIFLFMCDCLDMKFGEEATGQYIREKFEYDEEENLFYALYWHDIEVFKRFLSYYNNATDAGETRGILGQFSLFLNDHEDPLKKLDPEVNKEKTLKFVSLVVDFLDQRQEVSLQISQKDFEEEYFLEHLKKVCNILMFLFSNKYYEIPLKKFLKLLSSVYSNLEIQFDNDVVESLESHFENMSQETLDYILENLRILEESKAKKILKGISHLILRMNTQLFESVYKREETVEIDSLPADIQSLLERDPRGMTRLHRAAFCNDEQTVDQILVTISTSCLSNETESKNWGKEVLYNVIASDEKGITPLYVAAASERENLCQKMLIFLKEMLSEDELRKYLTDTNGFLSIALWDAMKWKKIQMFRIILESVQKFLGQDYLIALMKDENQRNESIFDFGNMFSLCHDQKLLEIVLEVIVSDKEGYKHLFDLLFQNWESIEQAQRIDNETFQEILSLNGLDDFIKRILDTNLRKGMYFVVCKIFRQFTTEQREQLCRILVTGNSGTKSYFARYWLDLKVESGCQYSKVYLECFSEYLGKSVVNELLVCNEYEVIKKVLGTYDGNSESKAIIDFMLSFLSNKEDEKIHHMMVIALQLIEKITETSDQEDKNYHNDNRRGILLLVFERIEDCVKESHLREFVDLITNRASTKSKEMNIWIDYLVEGGWYVYKFLKCVLDKLGPSAVEELASKEAVTQVLTHEYIADALVDALLCHVSGKKREEIEVEIIKNAPATLKTLIDTKPEKVEHFWKNIVNRQYVTKYADRDVLLRLIEIITTPYKPNPDSDETTSVWSSYLFYSHYTQIWSRGWTEKVDEFLLCVSVRVGKNQVKELDLHSYYYSDGDRQSVISTAASYGENDLVEAMLAHLTDEDRQEIQRDHVEEHTPIVIRVQQ